MKVLVVYYSMYGHVHQMALAIAEGAKEVSGAQVEMRRVPETLPDEVLSKMGALEARKSFSDVPICSVEELPAADAVLFGTPTRFGNMCGQMRQFLDATGPAMGERGPRRKGWKCFREFRNAAWRSGIYYPEFPHNSASPRDGRGGTSVRISGADAHR